MNFNFLNYSVRYSVKGDSERPFGEDVCFSGIFYDRYLNVKKVDPKNKYYRRHLYTIDLIKYDNDRDDSKDNICLLTKEALTSYLKDLKTVFNFTFTITEFKDKFTITLKFNGQLLEHKILLTCIRFTFEFPLNFLLNDAIKLKTISPFKSMNILNLLSIVNLSCRRAHNGHSLVGGDKCYLRTLKDWQKVINKAALVNNEVQSVFGKWRDKLNGIEWLEDTPENSLTNEASWNDDKFKKRCAIYLNNYKIIKSKKNG